MKKTIMYCPLNDGHIIHDIHEFAQKKFDESVQGFRRFYGTVILGGTNDFQRLICNFPVVDIENSNILIFDKVVADYATKHCLDEFWQKNNMQLQKPSIPQSTLYELFFVVAALMQLKTHWNKKHKPEKREYKISAEDSCLHEELMITGYSLKNVDIAINSNFQEVSVRIDLGNDIDIRLSDLTAFGDNHLSFVDEKHLYKVTSTPMNYQYSGSLIAPCIDEKYELRDHLQGIYWTSQDLLYQVYIKGSEALTKLKLNEEGVEARAETLAYTSMRLGCSAHNIPKTYALVIVHGLVVDIRYQGQSVFLAYVPQEKFIRV